MRQEFERRRNFVVYRLRALPNVSCASPAGAFYVMPNVARYLDREFQGAPRSATPTAWRTTCSRRRTSPSSRARRSAPTQHIRISFATSMERLEEGMRRIEQALARLEEPRRLRPRALNNVVTKVADYAETRAVAGLETPQRAARRVRAHLPADAYFEWNAAIAGIVVQLRTTSPHLADFFQENFYPAPLEGDLEPHAVIYAVKDVPGRERPGRDLARDLDRLRLQHRVLRPGALARPAARRRGGARSSGRAARPLRRARRRRCRRAGVGRAGLGPHRAARRGAAAPTASSWWRATPCSSASRAAERSPT